VSRLLNGTNQWFLAGVGSRFANMVGPWTMMCWCYPTADANAAADNRRGLITTEQRAGSNNAIPLCLTYGRFDTGWANIGNAFGVTYYNGSSWAAAARDPTTVVLNRWYHVAAVLELTPSRVLRIYRNGVQVGTSSPVAPTACSIDTSLRFGSLWTPAGSGFFPGRVADFAIWSRALASGEIAAVAAGTQPWNIQVGVLTQRDTLSLFCPMTGLGAAEPDLGPNSIGMVLQNAPTADAGPPVGFPMSMATREAA
jgi:hypothetical protein